MISKETFDQLKDSLEQSGNMCDLIGLERTPQNLQFILQLAVSIETTKRIDDFKKITNDLDMNSNSNEEDDYFP